MKPVQKTNSNLFSRWLGLSSAGVSGTAPLQLMALEDRVLYSAGPVPVEVVDAGAGVDLLSQGDLLSQVADQDVTATDLGIATVEAGAVSTLDELLEQIDAVSSLDSISDIQPLEGVFGASIGFETSNDPVVGSSASPSVDDVQTPTIAFVSATVEAPLDERVTAAVSADVPVDFNSPETRFDIFENRRFVTNLDATAPEGDALSFSIVGGDDRDLFSINERYGILEFIDEQDFEQPGDSNGDNIFSVFVRVEDSQGIGTTQQFTAEVLNFAGRDFPNRPADFASAQSEFETPENQGFVVDLFSFDPDDDRNTIYSIIGGADRDLFTITPITGIVNFVVAPDYDNPDDSDNDNFYELLIRVEDEDGEGTTRSFTFEVTDVDDNQPAFFDTVESQFRIFENSTAVFNLEATDPEGKGISYSIVDSADSEFFTINSGDGKLSFVNAPDADNPGSNDADNFYSVTVRVEDPDGEGEERDLTIEVAGVDEAAFFTTEGSEFLTPENDLLAVNLSSAAPEGGPIRYSIVGGEDADLFTIGNASGRLSFLTSPDYENPGDSNGDNFYSVRVRVEDSDELGEERDLTIEVTDVDEGASFSQVQFEQNENILEQHQLVAEPQSGNTFTYEIQEGGDSGLFSLNRVTGEFSLLNAQDFENPGDENGDRVYSFDVLATSDTGFSVLETISVSILNVDEVAVLSSRDFTVTENQQVTSTVNANAADGSNFTFTVDEGVLDASAFTFNSNGNNFQFVLNSIPDFENPADLNGDGIYEFILTATSDTGFTVTETIFVTVDDDQNEIATFATSDFDQLENSIVPHQLDAVASDGSVITYGLLDGGDSGLVTLNSDTGVFSLLAAPDFENPTDANADNVYSFTIVATSATGFSATQEIEVEVFDVVEVAEISEVEFFTPEGQQDVLTIVATTEDGSNLTYSVTGGADQDDFTFVSSGNTFEFQLNSRPDFENPTDSDFGNTYEFVLQATSDTGFSVTETISVTVTDVIEFVTFTQSDFNQLENSIDQFQLTSIADDGSELVYSIVGGDDVTRFQFSEDSTQFSFIEHPNFESLADFNGDNVYEFVVRVQSATGIDATELILVNVVDVVETVAAVDDLAIVDEGGTVLVDVVANDIVDPLDRLSLFEVLEVSNGTASFNSNGQLEFVHDDSETVSADVTYRIVNQEGESDTATVTFTVNPVDDMAVVADDTVTLDSTLPTTFPVEQFLLNDSDIDSDVNDLNLRIVDAPLRGTVEIIEGQVTYTPFGGFEGSDVFSYQLVSAGGDIRSDVARVELTLEAGDFGNLDNDSSSDAGGDTRNDSADDNDEDMTDGTGLNRPTPVEEDDKLEIGKVQAIPSIIEFETIQNTSVSGSGFQGSDSRSSLLLNYEGNVYNYLGRTQFLDLAKQELSDTEIGGSFSSKTDFNHQLSLSQLPVVLAPQRSSDPLDISNLDIGEIIFNAPFIGVTALSVFAISTGLTLTSSQIHRVLDVGLLLDDDESIEDIVSS